MKNTILLCLNLFIINCYSQTVFTFVGNGNWVDETQWENGNYPGLTINENDVVEVLGELTIPVNTTITNFGTIESYSSADGSTPIINVFGTLVNNKDIHLNTTQITIQNKGRVITNDPSIINITNGSTLTNIGYIHLYGGELRISSLTSSIINERLIDISNGAVVNVFSGVFENSLLEDGVISPVLDNNGAFNLIGGKFDNKGGYFSNLSDGILTISTTFINLRHMYNEGQIIFNEAFSFLVNSGYFVNTNELIIRDSGTFNSTSGSSFTNYEGNVEISSNSKIINRADLFSILSGKIINNGTFDNETEIEIEASGELENNGTLNSNLGAQIQNLGTLSGINIEHSYSGSFSNDGILSPGNSMDATGTYLLNGFLTSYTQDHRGKLNIEIGGKVKGDNYDQVIVESDATLSGTLNIYLIDGFEPEIGDSFNVLTHGRNLSGEFRITNFPVLPTGRKWDAVQYDNNIGVVISVIEDTSLSINDLNKDVNAISIYPNPTFNKVYLSGISKQYDVTVFDIFGKEVFVNKTFKNEESVDLSSLNTGIYLLKINNFMYKVLKK